MVHPTKLRQRGTGYIELLASSLILALCLVAALSLFGFSMTLVQKTGDEGVAYNLARSSIEDARQQGFTNLAEGSTTTYYNSVGQNPTATPATTGFKVVRSVASDKISGGGPAPDAIRTVTVNVYLLPSTSTALEQAGTYLVRSGV